MQEIEKLLDKYNKGQIEKEELEFLLNWFHKFEASDTLPLSEEDFEEAKLTCQQNLLTVKEDKQIYFKRSSWVTISAVAAVVLVILGLGIFYTNNDNIDYALQNIPFQDSTNLNSPVLIVEGGSTIYLSDTSRNASNQIAGNINIFSNNRLAYNLPNDITKKERNKYFHTLKTPLKCVYLLQLEDGTNIYLNSLSSIKFPSTFVGLDKREIELQGEAYFEVSACYLDQEKKIRKPFIVHTKDQIIEVLGTSFNISAYDYNDTKTTLVHGKVSVAHTNPVNKNDKILLTNPGDQVYYTMGEFGKQKVGILEETAWRHGKLIFNDLDLYSIMRTIARWYPIEIEFKADFQNDLFGGTITKNKKLEDVLKLLEATGDVKFKIEPIKGKSKERRVLVMK